MHVDGTEYKVRVQRRPEVRTLRNDQEYLVNCTYLLLDFEKKVISVDLGRER